MIKQYDSLSLSLFYLNLSRYKIISLYRQIAFTFRFHFKKCFNSMNESANSFCLQSTNPARTYYEIQFRSKSIAVFFQALAILCCFYASFYAARSAISCNLFSSAILAASSYAFSSSRVFYFYVFTVKFKEGFLYSTATVTGFTI